MKQFPSWWLTPFTCVLVTACAVKSQPENKEISPLTPITKLIPKDTALHKTYVADIQAIKNVEIRNRVTGYLDKIFVDEGQTVKKGQLLFSISDAEYKAEMARANAQLNKALAESKTAELEVERVTLLVNKKVVPSTELEVAKANLKAAEAKIAEAQSALTDARTRLSYTQIVAPFNGVINRIPLKVGSLLNEGTLLTTVSDISSVYAYFSISENEYLHYLKTKLDGSSNSSNRVELTLADGSRYAFPGEIETTASEFEDGTGSIAFRARFPNPEHLLKHGASGNVVLQTKVEDALMLPQKAVLEIQDKNFVFVVDYQNKVKMKSFVPETRIAHFYLVQSGLQPGERIVYEGVQNLRDGMKIKPREVEMGSGL